MGSLGAGCISCSRDFVDACILETERSPYCFHRACLVSQESFHAGRDAVDFSVWCWRHQYRSTTYAALTILVKELSLVDPAQNWRTDECSLLSPQCCGKTIVPLRDIAPQSWNRARRRTASALSTHPARPQREEDLRHRRDGAAPPGQPEYPSHVAQAASFPGSAIPTPRILRSCDPLHRSPHLAYARLQKANSRMVNMPLELDESGYKGIISPCSPDPQIRAHAIDLSLNAPSERGHSEMWVMS
jgi:hypothetical protein